MGGSSRKKEAKKSIIHDSFVPHGIVKATELSSGSSSTPVTPCMSHLHPLPRSAFFILMCCLAKVRKEPDSPGSPLSQLELKRRKFVADKPVASSSQSQSTPSPSPRNGNSKGKEKACNVVDEDMDA